jgi:hypothetical protein
MLEGKRAYICSPLSADTKEKRWNNMERAKFYLMQMKRLYHCRTFASHAHMPLMLDDTIPEEREAGMQIGKILIELCDAVIICGKHVSNGMREEIRTALERQKEVYWYDSLMKPNELMRIESWRDINDEVQI